MSLSFFGIVFLTQPLSFLLAQNSIVFKCSTHPDFVFKKICWSICSHFLNFHFEVFLSNQIIFSDSHQLRTTFVIQFSSKLLFFCDHSILSKVQKSHISRFSILEWLPFCWGIKQLCFVCQFVKNLWTRLSASISVFDGFRIFSPWIKSTLLGWGLVISYDRLWFRPISRAWKGRGLNEYTVSWFYQIVSLFPWSRANKTVRFY